MIYFIQAELGDPIKIGYTTKDVKNRLSQLQTSHPKTLVCLGTKEGGVDEERQLHDKFTQHRIRGEWFEPSEELLSYITTHVTPYISEAVLENNRTQEEESQYSYYCRMAREVTNHIEQLDTSLGEHEGRINLDDFAHFLAFEYLPSLEEECRCSCHNDMLGCGLSVHPIPHKEKDCLCNALFPNVTPEMMCNDPRFV